MADERPKIPARDLGRWLFVAALLLAGVLLYFRYAPRAEPIVSPTTQEPAP